MIPNKKREKKKKGFLFVFFVQDKFTIKKEKRNDGKIPLSLSWIS